MPNGSCYHHGGASLAGIASRTFKDGKRSKYLPHKLVARYAEAEVAPELREFNTDLALLESRLAELLGALDTGESGALWRKALDAYDDFEEAQAKHDTPKAGAAIQALGIVLKAGVSEAATWDEIYRVLEKRGRTLQREQNRLIQAKKVFDEHQMLALAKVVIDTVKRNVSDGAALAAIQSDVLRHLASLDAGPDDRTGDP